MKVHLYEVKVNRSAVKLTLQILIAAAVVALFVYGFSVVPGRAASEGLAVTERAIRSAAVNCYAIEGAYPVNIAYMEEHYGLLIDYDKYFVQYEYFRNMMPSIRVVSLSDYVIIKN